MPADRNQIYFNALLPDSPKPEKGYPVVIFGHGFGDSRFGGPTAVSPTLASAGFAVVAITAAGHGHGPESTVIFTDKSGRTTTLTAGGRGVDLNGDGVIESQEGCLTTAPVAFALRDCFRQTSVDLLQLVRAIRSGIDLDGDGTPDLDCSRIYYGGDSLGSLYGTVFNALEPHVRAAALNTGGATVVNIARWSPAYRAITTFALAQRTPPLLNKDKAYDEDYVLRDQPVKTLSVPGAIDIQNFFETIEWLGMQGDPLAFAPHLKRSPLGGSDPKPVLVQFARGDLTMPNPATSALIRAADLREISWMYRHDRALTFDPALPLDPHPYLVLFVSLDSGTLQLPDMIGLAISSFTQQQIADFFTADGQTNPDPNNALVFLLLRAPLYEVPARLPEDLGFTLSTPSAP
jgi:hypothetical protein